MPSPSASTTCTVHDRTLRSRSPAMSACASGGTSSTWTSTVQVPSPCGGVKVKLDMPFALGCCTPSMYHWTSSGGAPKGCKSATEKSTLPLALMGASGVGISDPGSIRSTPIAGSPHPPRYSCRTYSWAQISPKGPRQIPSSGTCHMACTSRSNCIVRPQIGPW